MIKVIVRNLFYGIYIKVYGKIRLNLLIHCILIDLSQEYTFNAMDKKTKILLIFINK